LGSNVGRLVRQTGDIAAGARQTRNEAGAHRIPRRREDDWNGCGRLLCRQYRWGPRRDDDIDLEPDELRCDLGKALGAPLSPAILDRDVATLDPTDLAQPLHESGNPWARNRKRVRT